MTNNQRHRLWRLSLAVITCIGIVLFVLTSLQDSILYYLTPSELLELPNANKVIRLGGQVAKGSVSKNPETLTIVFAVTDHKKQIVVEYQGVVPDLFREGQGVIAEGKLGKDGIFRAKSILAKHDENYKPPELKSKLS